MNNNVSPEKKDSVLKSLAIAGFIGIIILIAWLSVQLINVLPSAFSSLASLAEGINQYQGAEVVDETDGSATPVASLIVNSNAALVNAGEPVVVSWEAASNPGTYTFSYACNEGVAVDLIDVDGLKSINCDTNYNVGDITSLTMSVDSEKNQYTDLRYSVSFLRTNDTTPRATGNASLAVVNSSLSQTDMDEVIVEEEVEEPTTEVVVVPTNPTPSTPTPTTPVYTQEFVYAIPTSDPNGQVDLTSRFLNVGSIRNNSFVIGSIEKDDEGAIQFEVKNIGTKTSNDWTFSVELPNGSTFISDDQAPLKPNERAVLTIGFTTDDESQFTFVVEVETAPDRNSQNNNFSQPIQFVN